MPSHMFKMSLELEEGGRARIIDAVVISLYVTIQIIWGKRSMERDKALRNTYS